jgi:hypothetical protein
MRRYTRFDCSIWEQPWFRELPDDSPLLWLWLNHNPHITACGLLKLDLSRASAATLLPERDIARWLAAWHSRGLLRSDYNFVLLPCFAAEQGGGPARLRLAARQARALVPQTALAQEWLDRQTGTGDNVGEGVEDGGSRE